MTQYEIYTTVFAAIVAISTVITCIASFSLIKETKRMRHAQAEPQIIPYFKNGDFDITLFYLVITNVGQGVAYNVSFQIKKEFDIPEEPMIRLDKCAIINTGVNFFPAKMKHEYFMGTFAHNHKKIVDSSVELKITYKDVFGFEKQENYLLNLKEIEGKSRITPPDSEIGRISYYLEKINKTLIKAKEEA
ncbi:MAG TPA: hypothetical protein PLL00_05700 [Bacteroidia bacterium]|nr:hypothetical protein [Bacteroidia bacterium]